jgi:hypothetical protein
MLLANHGSELVTLLRDQTCKSATTRYWDLFHLPTNLAMSV